MANGYKSVNVQDSQVQLVKNGWYTTAQEGNVTKIYDKFINNKFNAFTKEAKSFGFDKRNNWYGFEIKNSNKDEDIFLDLKDILAKNVTCFEFEEGRLVKREENGYTTPIEKRGVKSFSIRYKIDSSQKPKIYLLKINSMTTQFAAFSIADKETLDREWAWHHFFN